MWLPDTNVWIALLNASPTPVTERFRAHNPAEIFLCDIVKMELYFGAFRSARQERNLALLERVCSTFRSLPFDSAAARACGEIRATLATAGTPIGPYDAQIAAIALVHHITLVTHNVREFGRIPNLKIEDWEV